MHVEPGLTYRIARGILVRVDNEYQAWADIVLMNPGTHILNLKNFTVGVM